MKQTHRTSNRRPTTAAALSLDLRRSRWKTTAAGSSALDSRPRLRSAHRRQRPTRPRPSRRLRAAR
eukprot:2278147-Prymnesium_polylepis.3